MPQLTVDVLPPAVPSNSQLALEYNYDHASTTVRFFITVSVISIETIF